jgi:hypothetical protein
VVIAYCKIVSRIIRYRGEYLRYVLTFLCTVRNVNVTYEDERYTEINSKRDIYNRDIYYNRYIDIEEGCFND